VDRRPSSPILRVASELFETVGPVRAREQVNASVVFKIFDTDENDHDLSIRCDIARTPYGPKKLSIVGKRSVPAGNCARQ
jgi:hypothetical protein